MAVRQESHFLLIWFSSDSTPVIEGFSAHVVSRWKVESFHIWCQSSLYEASLLFTVNIYGGEIEHEKRLREASGGLVRRCGQVCRPTHEGRVSQRRGVKENRSTSTLWMFLHLGYF
ncbi:hypothetical protein F2Q69_00032001 [Brassica cretica]|uniref:Uncharacterized protein n=1 Tax=Brassica cretica TaxID=69181 RepID=A0A8S9S7K3_BRACR|nr:hypothetical protein F2Q69_00032001 [Brassica cretica]